MGAKTLRAWIALIHGHSLSLSLSSLPPLNRPPFILSDTSAHHIFFCMIHMHTCARFRFLAANSEVSLSLPSYQRPSDNDLFPPQPSTTSFPRSLYPTLPSLVSVLHLKFLYLWSCFSGGRITCPVWLLWTGVAQFL